MNKKFFSGDSIDQAVMQAARYFKIDPEEVAYREVERRHGFLRSRRRAVIEVDTENPTRPRDERRPAEEAQSPAPAASPQPTARSSEERQEAEERQRAVGVESGAGEPEVEVEPEVEPKSESFAAPRAKPRRRRGQRPFQELSEEPIPLSKRYPPAEGELAEAAQTALARIFELGGLDLSAEIMQGEERLQVELRGSDEEALLEDRGRLLLAIQHLLPRMLRGLTGRSTPCWVDCDNFHEIRTEQLRDLAQRVATEVRNSRRSRMLEPMSPDERRIVHLTLADDPAVETISQGNGLFKRVQVRPQKMRPRGFDPYSR